MFRFICKNIFIINMCIIILIAFILSTAKCSSNKGYSADGTYICISGPYVERGSIHL